MMPQAFGSIDASHIPELLTPRLRLRGFALGDLDDAAAMRADPAVMRHIGGKTRTRAEVWASLQRSVGGWALLGYGYWAVCDRHSGRFLGEVGLIDGLRNLNPSISGTPEAGWCFAQHAWGQGYASEALAAALTWTDDHLRAPRTVCMIDQGHAVSAHLARKHGYVLLREATLGDDRVEIFTRVRPAGQLAST